MDLIKKLKDAGIEVTSEMEEVLKGDYITTQEHEKKLGKVEAERDSLVERAENAEATLKGFEGKDFEQLNKDLATWKEKAEQAEKEYAKKLEARDYSDAIKELTKDIKFSSNAAKKSFMADLESNPLQMRDGKVLGFDDFLKNYKESDSDAFVAEENKNRSSFTGNINTNNSNNGTDIAQMRAIMGLSTDK